MNKDLKAWLDGSLKESKVITITSKLVKGNIDGVAHNSEGRGYRSILFTGIPKPVYHYFKSDENKLAARIERIDQMKETVYCEITIVLGVKGSAITIGDESFTPNINQLYLQEFKLAEKEDLANVFE